jgi:hypothetical protein
MEFMPIVPLGEDEMDDQEKGSLPAELPIIALAQYCIVSQCSTAR